jgi:ABC-2 type transport system ATP-binding protein
MIEVSHLTKAYGSFYAVNDISFSVGKGEIVGFLGPNGAGKSTTLRILAGFLGMTSGKVTIAGHDIVDASDEARAAIGYMPEATPLYTEMRVVEYLRFRAELKGVARKERKARVEQAMEEAKVDELADTMIAKLSKGYRQRVGLADALVARPPLLILDEPTAGLDPNQIREVRALVRNLGERHTVLLSTHILSEVESTCSRAIVIARGKLVAQGSLEELRARRRSGRAHLVLRLPEGNDETALRDRLGKLEGVSKLDVEPAPGALLAVEITWQKKVEDTAVAMERVVRAAIEAGFEVREATPAKATLDEVFAQLTGGPGDAPLEDEPPDAPAPAASAAKEDVS